MCFVILNEKSVYHSQLQARKKKNEIVAEKLANEKKQPNH